MSDTSQTDQLGYVVAALQRRKRRWGEIAETSGVPYPTLTKVARRVTKDPRSNTVNKLFTTLRALDASEPTAKAAT